MISVSPKIFRGEVFIRVLLFFVRWKKFCEMAKKLYICRTFVVKTCPSYSIVTVTRSEFWGGYKSSLINHLHNQTKRTSHEGPLFFVYPGRNLILLSFMKKHSIITLLMVMVFMATGVQTASAQHVTKDSQPSWYVGLGGGHSCLHSLFQRRFYGLWRYPNHHRLHHRADELNAPRSGSVPRVRPAKCVL